MVFFCPKMLAGTHPRTALGADATHPTPAKPKMGRYLKRLRLAPVGGEIRRGKAVAKLGMTDFVVTRGFDHGPSIGIGEKCFDHESIQTMSAPVGTVGAKNRCTSKRQITNRIERFVAHELVGVTQAFTVDDPIIADGDGVFQGSTKGKTRRPKPLNILHEAEGTSAGKLPAERPWIYVDFNPLGPDHLVLEVNLNVETETVMRSELTLGAIVLNTDRLEDLQVPTGRIELGQADFIDRLNETDRTAVHNRHFGAVDLNKRIVDTEAAQSREQMLHGRDSGPIAVPKNGAQRDARDPLLIGSDLGYIPVTVGN